MPFSEWLPIDDGGDIPFHQIAQFKYNIILFYGIENKELIILIKIHQIKLLIFKLLNNQFIVTTVAIVAVTTIMKIKVIMTLITSKIE